MINVAALALLPLNCGGGAECDCESSPCGWHGRDNKGKRRAFHQCEFACGASAATPSGTCGHKQNTGPPWTVSGGLPEGEATPQPTASHSVRSVRGEITISNPTFKQQHNAAKAVPAVTSTAKSTSLSHMRPSVAFMEN